MKVAVICNTDSLVIPSLRSLKETGVLISVGIPEGSHAQLRPVLIQAGLASGEITLFKKETWKNEMHTWLQQHQPDTVWVFAFPWKIPGALLTFPSHGFINFHFGLLPKYRGADPIFWQLKNKERSCGLVVHQMTEEVDRGPVLWKEETPANLGETYAMNCMRLGFVAAALTTPLMAIIQDPARKAEAQCTDNKVIPFFKRPAVTDFTIHWKNHSSEDIEWMVNACNPKYDGAVTRLRGMEVRILEVSPIDVKDVPQAEPGTIIHADTVYGLVVICADKKCIRINVLHLVEGYLSGIKLVSMGVKAGEQFG